MVRVHQGIETADGGETGEAVARRSGIEQRIIAAEAGRFSKNGLRRSIGTCDRR